VIITWQLEISELKAHNDSPAIQFCVAMVVEKFRVLEIESGPASA
jgi:hypothetical protein